MELASQLRVSIAQAWGTIQEPKGRRTFAAGSHYQAKACEDVTVETRLCVTVVCKVQ
jgi:hypothetical protein